MVFRRSKSTKRAEVKLRTLFRNDIFLFKGFMLWNFILWVIDIDMCVFLDLKGHNTILYLSCLFLFKIINGASQFLKFNRPCALVLHCERPQMAKCDWLHFHLCNLCIYARWVDMNVTYILLYIIYCLISYNKIHQNQ